MRITGLASPLQALLLATLPKAPKFAVAELPVRATPPATVVGQPVSVEMLVTLAQSESPIDRRRRAASHVDRGLRTLERLDPVAGLSAVERVHEVDEWTATLGETQDPALASLIKEIELRMRVELAKHEVIA